MEQDEKIFAQHEAVRVMIAHEDSLIQSRLGWTSFSSAAFLVALFSFEGQPEVKAFISLFATLAASVVLWGVCDAHSSIDRLATWWCTVHPEKSSFDDYGDLSTVPGVIGLRKPRYSFVRFQPSHLVASLILAFWFSLFFFFGAVTVCCSIKCGCDMCSFYKQFSATATELKS